MFSIIDWSKYDEDPECDLLKQNLDEEEIKEIAVQT
jgi:hypothetical protein